MTPRTGARARTSSSNCHTSGGVEAEWLCANDARFRDLVRKGGTPYFTTHVYLMSGRLSFDRDPKRVQAIWNEIRTVRATSEYRKLEEAAVRNYNGK